MSATIIMLEDRKYELVNKDQEDLDFQHLPLETPKTSVNKNKNTK